jgi:hypothetical protein
MSKTVYILISIVIIFLIAIATYTSYTPNSEKQKTTTGAVASTFKLIVSI